ncbi:NAD(P)/FAD-dependent oxidoreductase [Aneurinibacillus sp. Ricciae_BoGa-3]|uniref:NAD(P)/FAD-dependent oxidoreductase n=1 Tax=Aneurinibacillus sp. Ricciae_BoGa-3 TaxID=3022697 RepID=UPI00233FA6F9|nr:NAD(P)/FAD-dependent oxidoreductase [Aneurinibacillus sp. Ricciae_BoGa-3]WCK53171.1 NAD(P)/FAD-dependent oxidoreductase [Aneurinibacillus sp. Ricciae_BoGa-3]
MKHYDVIIVGGGVAGISALIWLKQLGLNAILFEKSDVLGGQLHKVHNEIIDYPGLFGLTGRDLLDRLQKHLQAMQCEWLTETEVVGIENNNAGFVLSTFHTNKNERKSYAATYIIVAAGATERHLGVPGEEQLYSRMGELSTSKSPEIFKGKKVVIVGGGNRALEGAYRIRNWADSITIVHRHDRFKAKAEYLQPLLKSSNVRFELFSQIKSIVWDSGLAGVIILNTRTAIEKYEEADYVLIRIGVQSNCSLLDHLVEIDNGCVKTDRWGKTTHDQVYAIGDLSTPPEYSSISLHVGQGMAAAKNIWLSLSGRSDSVREGERFNNFIR